MPKCRLGSRSRCALLVAFCATIAACNTPADFSDGINSYSQAVMAADTTGKSLYTAAQKARQNILLRALPQILATPGQDLPSLDPACDVSQVASYKAGACTVNVGAIKFGQPNDAPPLGSLSRYAAKLADVVADKTCDTLQSDSKGIATAVSDIAKDAGRDVAAEAGAISDIVATLGCAAIAQEQLHILRAATKAADPLMDDLVGKITAIDNDLYNVALRDAYQQANAPLMSLASLRVAATTPQPAAGRPAASASAPAAPAVDPNLDKEQAALGQAIALIAAIDQLRQSPPGPTITKIATLHHALTKDLQSPAVTLERFQRDADAFVSEATTLANAAEVLAQASASPAVPASGKKSGK